MTENRRAKPSAVARTSAGRAFGKAASKPVHALTMMLALPNDYFPDSDAAESPSALLGQC
jgi:hypothetical protein